MFGYAYPFHTQGEHRRGFGAARLRRNRLKRAAAEGEQPATAAMLAQRPNDTRVRGAGAARTLIRQIMDGPASPAADC